MLYTLHEAAYHAATPLRFGALSLKTLWSSPANPWSDTALARNIVAMSDVFESVTRRYGKPEWGLDQVEIGGVDVPVSIETVWSSPWCNLIRFRRDGAALKKAGRPADAPRVLIVAPLSGHYATLLRGTVEAWLSDFDVYITDWVNARNVPLMEGRFGFHDYIDHVRTMLEALGERAHVVAVCQPGPPVLAACALMAEDAHPQRPLSMTYMGSPIDARLSPTLTNELAEQKPFAWFRSNMIYTVPLPYAGVGRRVYPGFVQLYSFMSMNEARHREAHWAYFNDLVAGDGDSAARHEAFYDEYLSVLDLTEEFYLQTVDIVFQKHLLARGELWHRGRRVDLSAITDIALMTVEGENDDISGVGQTQAAHGLCPNIPEAMRVLHVQAEVGHYGVFNGRRFREEIYPLARDFMNRAQEAGESGTDAERPSPRAAA